MTPKAAPVLGGELRCSCGSRAIDVAPDLELSTLSACSWHCASGHLNISGARPGFSGFQQMRFDNDGEAAKVERAHTVK